MNYVIAINYYFKGILVSKMTIHIRFIKIVIYDSCTKIYLSLIVG